MKNRRKPWHALLALFVGILFVAFSFGLDFIRREGMEGVFDRKRKAFEQVAPDALPIFDRIEEGFQGPKAPKDAAPEK
ncbi:hypothetical protein EON79_05160 [bacterium]|nr:MAG: hypothetical protein EON79_05160 [bacterium]